MSSSHDSRLKIAGGLLAAGISLSFTLATWGLAVEPRLLDVREIRASLPNLPHGWRGQRLALLSDPQVGILFSNTGTIGHAVERALRSRPAAALLAGDFVYDAVRDPAPCIQTIVGLLCKLPRAGVPTFAVLGNHDYGEGGSAERRRGLVRDLRVALTEAGIRVLLNEVACLSTAAGETLHIVGIGPHAPGQDRPREAISRVPEGAARVVLMHNPLSFRSLPPGSAPLALAGHTHGGQIRFPGKPEWSLGRFAMAWPEYVDGWVDGYGQPGNRLFVTRGLGFSNFPIRFGCMPELTMITLDTRHAAC